MELTGSVTHPPVPFPAACVGTPLVTFLTVLINATNQDLEREFCARRDEPAGGDEEYDFVVVGGGAAGCILAERLSENPRATVLLLERGGTEPSMARVPSLMTPVLRANVAQFIVGVPEETSCNGTGCILYVPQVLGGGSSLNALLYVRGSSVDFDDWAAKVGDSDWSYKEVLPYFRESERNMDPLISINSKYHGTSGPLRVSWPAYQHPVVPLLHTAMAAAGEPFRLDCNAEGQLGYTDLQTTAWNGERWSTYRAYLKPAMGRSNLRVRTYATATRVVLDQANARAVAVEYRDAAGRTRRANARKEVVLTAGAIGTPHLLMLSGIGPTDVLGAANIQVRVNLPVGQGLQDHVRVPGLEFSCEPPLCQVDWDHRRQDIFQYNTLRRGPMSANNLITFGDFMRTAVDAPPPLGTGEAPAKQPDVQVIFMGTTQEDDGVRCLALDLWRFNRIIYMPVLLHPRSRGSVRLNPANPLGPPIVRLGYLTDEGGHDVAVLLDSFKLGLRLVKPLEKMGIRLNTTAIPQCRDHEFASEDYFRCVIRATSATIWHWSSTCAMGRDDDDEAVVDSELLVKGVEGLRLADASVFPTLPSGNTHAATAMVAERAADLIRAAHGLL